MRDQCSADSATAPGNRNRCSIYSSSWLFTIDTKTRPIRACPRGGEGAGAASVPFISTSVESMPPLPYTVTRYRHQSRLDTTLVPAPGATTQHLYSLHYPTPGTSGACSRTRPLHHWSITPVVTHHWAAILPTMHLHGHELTPPPITYTHIHMYTDTCTHTYIYADAHVVK